MLAQQQTSTAPSALNPPKHWTPAHFHPVSSTSSSDIEVLGSNADANLRTLSFAAVKTEPTETNKNPHSGKKHLLEDAQKDAQASQAKRHK